jgi:hypothetical protein
VRCGCRLLSGLLIVQGSFQANVANADRVLRFVFGKLLMMAVFILPTAAWLESRGSWKDAAAVVGIVFLVAAIFRICSGYSFPSIPKG